MVFIFYLEWLPGPGTWVHVQQPGIFEQLQEKDQGQDSGLSNTHNRCPTLCYTHCRLKAVLPGLKCVALQDRHPKSSAIHIQLCLRL